MDTDLSLIEISGEDDDEDSLLLLQQQQVQQQFVANSNLFSCSPLQLLRSKTSSRRSPIPVESTAAKEETEKPSCSYHIDSCNKENMNASKTELPKLSMEPQQMKRKKKGGGYNLRKSLAWDRAFFTEEGVLDPVELSMINGNFGKSSGEILSLIKEDEMELSSGSSGCYRNSAHRKAREENLLKGLPERTPRKDRKIDGGLLPKPNSPARANLAPSPAAKRKVLSPHDVNKSGSKRNTCPRPVPSSSLKSLASLSASKATAKEPRVSKIPVPKHDPRLLSATTKTAVLGTSYSKHKPVSQPASMQKNDNLKSLSKNTKAPNNVKAGTDNRRLFAKSSIQHSRNVACSPLEISPSTNLQHPVVTEAKNTLQKIRDSVISKTSHASTVSVDEPSKNEVSIPKNVNYIGGIKQPQLQTVKPSGLRMPSPSMGFFGQSKASTSHRTAQPCSLPESSFSNMQKLGALNSVSGLRPPRPPSKIPAMVNNTTTNKNMKFSNSCSGSPVSTAIPVSHENMKSNLEDSNMQKADMKVPSDLNGLKTSEIIIAKKKQLHYIPCDAGDHSLEHGESYKIELPGMENNKFQKPENKASQSECCEQPNKNTDIQVADVCRRSEDLSAGCLECANFPIQLRSAVQVKVPVLESGETSGTSRDVKGQFQRELGLLKPSIPEIDRISDGSQELQMSNGIMFKENKSSEDLQRYDTASTVDVSLKPQNCYANEVENSDCLLDTVYTKQAKDSVLGEGNTDRRSHAGEAHMQSLNDDLAVESCCSALITSSVDNQFMVVDDANDNFEEQAERSGHHLVVDQGSEDNYELHLKDYLLQEKSFFSEESQQESVLQGARSIIPEGSNSFGQPAVKDCGLDESEYMKCQLVENVPSGSVDSKSGVENHKTEIEHPHLTSQHNPAVQVAGDSELSHTVQRFDTREHQYSLSIEKHTTISDFHPGEEVSCCDQISLRVHNDLLCSEHDVTEQSVEQPNLKNLCHSECDERYLEGDQNAQPSNDLLFKGRTLLEGPQIIDNNGVADVSPKVHRHAGNGLQSSHGVCHHEITDQASKETAGINDYNVTKEILAGDGRAQCRDGSLLIDSCYDSLSPSTVADQYTLAADHVNGESEEHSQLQDTIYVNKVSQDDQLLRLSNQFSIADNISKEPEEKNVKEIVRQATSEFHSSMISGPPTACKTGKLILDDMNSPTDKNQEKLDNSTFSIEDKNASPPLKKSGNDRRQSALTIKPPPYAVPFSDEWLAAFEAAGEEILTMKSGAVQNSPPDKAPPEPGPYSPVKRKNNQAIGPYDCTKYTNIGP